MTDPLSKDGAKVALGHRNHEVHTLPTDRADQALTECVGLWNASRRLENHQTHRLKGPIDAFRVIVSRSWITNRCHWSPGTIIRNCCAVQSAVGCSVTFQ